MKIVHSLIDNYYQFYLIQRIIYFNSIIMIWLLFNNSFDKYLINGIIEWNSFVLYYKIRKYWEEI